MPSAELVLAGVSVAALSVDIFKGVLKTKELLETRQKFVDESGALQARFDAATTRFRLLRAVLIGPDETKDPPLDSFVYELSSEARRDVLQVLERLRDVVSIEIDAAGATKTQGEVDAERGRALETSGGHRRSLASLSPWRWAWSGKDRCINLVDDYCMWVDVMYDAIRLFLLSVEIDQRKLKKLATVSLAVQNTEISQDCALLSITTTSPASSIEQLLIPNTQIRKGGKSAHLHVCQYQNRKVLLEDTISSQAADAGTAQEGLNRAYQLGLLLHQQKSDEFLQFPFVGLVQNMNEISLVYDLPQHFGSRSSSLLSDIELALEKGQRGTKPSLSARVRLAYRLALSLYRQHSVGWLHKGIRSSRILLFTPKDKSRPYNRIDNAFLFGLEYARAENQATLGSSDNDFMNNLYRHPERWNVPTSDFSKIHDIYALGVVMAEIGSWVPIKLCLGSNPERLNEDSSAVYEEIVGNMGKVLPSQAGDTYSEIVLSCLRGDMEQGDDVPVHLKFKERVVDRLKTLSITI